MQNSLEPNYPTFNKNFHSKSDPTFTFKFGKKIWCDFRIGFHFTFTLNFLYEKISKFIFYSSDDEDDEEESFVHPFKPPKG